MTFNLKQEFLRVLSLIFISVLFVIWTFLTVLFVSGFSCFTKIQYPIDRQQLFYVQRPTVNRKMCIHVTHHVRKYPQEDIQFEYLVRMINEAEKFQQMNITADYFIHHDNITFDVTQFSNYSNGNVSAFYYNYTNILNGFYLTWEYRSMVEPQILESDCDIYMYTEDDFLFTLQALKYWIKYNSFLYENGHYGLGFVQVENHPDIKGERVVGISRKLPRNVINISNHYFIANTVNPYQGLWIYNKDEIIRWMNSSFWNLDNIDGYGIAEKSAIGLQFRDKWCDNPWYTDILIPLFSNDKLHPWSKIFHLPAKYIRLPNSRFGKIPFNEVIMENGTCSWFKKIIKRITP